MLIVAESWAYDAATRAVMQGNRRRDTRPELAVRRLIHAAGLRYRVDHAPLEGHRRLKADIVFPRLQVAIFIDGCFWHGCREHCRPANINAEFWSTKIVANRDRDLRTNQWLHDAGWTVLRFWEHEQPEVVASKIVHEIRRRQGGGRRRTP